MVCLKEIGNEENTAQGVYEQEINYCNVSSVKIQCPDSKPSISKNVSPANDEIWRIFHLALVFYELFSGGERPPNELATSERPFDVSLPKMTLATKSDSDKSLSSDPKRHCGPSSSGGDDGLCKLVFQSLKLQGVTSPLCLLVSNMLDGINGDISRNECYISISDVRDDLVLMKENPKFLQDLDVDKLAVSGLPLQEFVIPRDEELGTIRSCYQHFASGSSGLVIIKGESGSGKSWLAQRVGDLVIEDGGVFLVGKYDQMKQSKPFYALTSAFDQYCDVILREKSSGWAKIVVDNLQLALGSDASHLANVIPKLGQILDFPKPDHAMDYTTCELDSDLNCRHSVQRLHHLICLFVEVISVNSKGPLTLVIDDFQWADESSIAVMNRLLRQEQKKLFFVCCCRDDDTMQNGSQEHPFWKMINDVCDTGVNKTMVNMTFPSLPVLNDAISSLLRLPPRLTKPLTNLVHNRTQGNPLFVTQLLLSLDRDGLLVLDLDCKRWVWDEEKIFSMKLPDNIADFFCSGIRRLPSEVQSSLQSLSLFGATAKLDHIKLIEKHFNIELVNPLHNAAKEGLVSYLNDSFSFCHDRIQEICYGLVEDQYRCCNHLSYGKCLMEHYVEGDDITLFTAVNQIDLGGPMAIDASDKEDYFTMAKHNVAAGKRAMAMSDFTSAFNFFGTNTL
jgi:predicted ATPase